MTVVSLDSDLEAGKRFVDQHPLEVGHVLPLSKTIFNEYFPPDQSFLLHGNKRVSGVFSYRSGRDKQVPTGVFRAMADTSAHLKEIVSEIERVALAEEKMVAQNFGVRI